MVSDRYPPALESMPVDDWCKDAMHANPAFRYLDLVEFDAKIDFQDFFDRGLPDNCADEGVVLKYLSGRPSRVSVPIVAIGNDSAFSVSTVLSGQHRVPTKSERAGIETYRARYVSDYRQAFNAEFGSDGSMEAEIPTLADATVLFEVNFPAQPHRLRISQWSRVSVAQHVYRVIVVDEMNGEAVVNTRQHQTAQGVL